jgi:glyoxylase-like metal-dependent hydrolase (beta-lactamase superfamily II)
MTDRLTLFAFNCGWFQCKPGFVVEGDEGPHLRAPVPAYLIDHPKGRALFDTGMGVRYRRELDNALADNKFGLQWFEGMDIATRLKAIDVDPASIDWIVNSHLHIDHCGGNAHLPNATVVVQRSELEGARAGVDPSLYDAVDYDTGQPVKAITGEHDLFGDGSVRIVPTYGHTTGHQSMIVRLGGRDVLLAGDCCYTERNLDVRVLPKNTANLEQGLETLDRLAALRENGTLILFGHDGRQWPKVTENVPFAPWAGR